MINHTEVGLPTAGQTNQAAVNGNTRNERRGPVDRIKHPNMGSVCVTIAEFLSENPVAGKVLFDHRTPSALNRKIGFRDHTGVGFESNHSFAGHSLKTDLPSCVSEQSGKPK